MTTGFQLDAQKLAELKLFIKLLEDSPDIIHAPELEFFRNFMKTHGATVPQPDKTSSTNTKPKADAEPPKEEEEEVISEDELDTEDEADVETVAGDEDDPDLLSPESEGPPECIEENLKELSDEQLDQLAALKEKAAEATEANRYEEALDLMTSILKLANPSAMLYAKRADLNLRLKKPIACIQDCDAAIRLNPDNGKAYRLRGKAYRALGDWEKAHSDLEMGQKIDYDDDVYAIQKYVADKWKVIDERRRAKLRRREERQKRNLLRQRRRRQAAARREYAAENARKQAEAFHVDDIDDDEDDLPNGSFPGGMPGAFGGSGAGAGADGGLGGLSGLLGGLMGNPEMKKAMNNPKVLQAVMEMMQNPASFSKYQNDPQVMAAFSSLMGSMKGAGGAVPGAGGCCGGNGNQCGPTGCGM